MEAIKKSILKDERVWGQEAKIKKKNGGRIFRKELQASSTSPGKTLLILFREDS